MYCLIQFYHQTSQDIKQHSPFLKILSIKLVIFLSFWQSASFLRSSCPTCVLLTSFSPF